MSNTGKVWRRSSSGGDWAEVYAPLDQQPEWQEANRVVRAVAEALSRQLAVGDQWARYQELCRAGAARADRLFLTFGIWQDGTRRWVTADFVQNQGLDSVVELDETLWRRMGGNPAGPATPGLAGHLWDFGIAWLPAYSNEAWAGNAVVTATHVAGQVSHPATLEDLVRLHDVLLGDAALRRREAQALPRGLSLWLYSEHEEQGIPVPREVPGLLTAKFALAASASTGSGSTSRLGHASGATEAADEAEAVKLLPQFLKDRLAEQKKARESGNPIPPPSRSTAVLERNPSMALAEAAAGASAPVARTRPLFEVPEAVSTKSPVEATLAAIPVRPVAERELVRVPESSRPPEPDLRELAAAAERLQPAEREVAATVPNRRLMMIAAAVAVLVLAGAGAALWLRPWESKPGARIPAPVTSVAPVASETTPPSAAQPAAQVQVATPAAAPASNAAVPAANSSAGLFASGAEANDATKAGARPGRNRNAARFETDPLPMPDNTAAAAKAEAQKAEEARRKAALSALTGQQ